jgi:hypothetical protein
MIMLLALAALSAGFYMGWRTRVNVENGRAHKKIELAGCLRCQLIYVRPKRSVCPSCGLPLEFKYFSGDGIDVKRS